MDKDNQRISARQASKPSVSIVIPFYNLESEAGRCLDSVLAQSFEDFEVICVNDGSVDGTADVLDSYAKSDARVRVIHKANGGLSDARNAGIAASEGVYATFIDGDDVVSHLYLESLVSAMEGASGRLVIGNCMPVRESDIRNALDKMSAFAVCKAVTREEACRRLLSKGLPSLAQAKLFETSYYRDNPFPLGVRYEEIRTIGKLMSCAKEVRIIEAPIYGYVMREGSIVHALNASGVQGIEYAEAIQIAIEDFRALGYDLELEIAFFRALMYTRVHDFTKRISTVGDASVIEDIAKTAVNLSYRDALQCQDASTAQKIRLTLYRFLPHVYDVVMPMYNRMTKGVE